MLRYATWRAAVVRSLAVREPSDRGRLPRVGDRVYRAGSAGHRRREGTFTSVYADPQWPTAVLFEVAWDAAESGDPAPWTGTSRGLPVACLYTPGWGWEADERLPGGAQPSRAGPDYRVVRASVRAPSRIGDVALAARR
jgi:hypothetical protein